MPWTALHDRIHQTIRQRKLLQRQQQVLVAVSGGQDSLCLIRILLDLQPKWGWHLAIAHCNHQWRSDASANAAYVAQLAQQWHLPYHEVTAHQPIQTEAAARQWRYQSLTAIATDNGFSTVVTGHTASDRAETLLYNLLRGSGADGLQALTWQRELAIGLQLVRPLLAMTRAETAQFCQDQTLSIWEDSTNHNWQYARNRIRQELLPYLHAHFNPQVEQNLAQTAELLQADVSYLEQQATVLRQQVSSPSGDSGGYSVNRHLLKGAPLALQRRVMRQILQALLPTAPNFKQIETLVALITAPNRSQAAPFPGGMVALIEGDWLKIHPHFKNREPETGLSLKDN